jgi:hypothetical protein
VIAGWSSRPGAPALGAQVLPRSMAGRSSGRGGRLLAAGIDDLVTGGAHVAAIRDALEAPRRVVHVADARPG